MDTLDRLIRVRAIKARLALAALGAARRDLAQDEALLARVAGLRLGQAMGSASAASAQARAQADLQLGKLAEAVADRAGRNRLRVAQQTDRLAAARAAVDAALHRRAEWEDDA